MPIKKDDKYQVDENKLWFKKWWPVNVPKNVSFEEKTLSEFLDEQVQKYANDNFIWFLETWVTYKEFHDYVDRFATALHNLGVKKGDVVAILMGNCIQYAVAYYAAVRIGAIATGVNPTYKPLEILHQLTLTNAKVLLTYDAVFDETSKSRIKKNLPYIGDILDKSKVEIIIYTNLADLAKGLGFKRTLGKMLGMIPKGKVNIAGAHKFMDLLKTEPNVPKVDIDVKTHPATYIMTGGTTGLPKAAVLTHLNCVSNAKQCMYWLGGEKPGLGNIGILPFFHSFGHTVVMNTTIAFGGWIMLFPTPPPTEELLEHIEELPAPEGLVYAGAEILFKRIADFPHLEKFPNLMGKLKLSVSGAGPLHAPVRDAFEKSTGGRIVEGYGLSEASPVVSAGNLFGNSPIGTIGMPFPGTEWGIWPSEDFNTGPICLGNPNETTFGEEHTGEICVHGPQVMLEYLNRPEETDDTIKEYNGKLWLLTGDIGFMNPDGTIEIRDRKKQLIKVAGHSVFPKEVESMLMQNEAVSEAAVSGLPDPAGKVGEIAKAWVELKPEYIGKITEEELKEWAKENMTHWKVPAIIEFIKEVPKDVLGKVQRRILQINDPIYKDKFGESK
ncbi:MAG: AMP-binding protein [Candidatus Heimdallarchaeota archaeon]